MLHLLIYLQAAVSTAKKPHQPSATPAQVKTTHHVKTRTHLENGLSVLILSLALLTNAVVLQVLMVWIRCHTGSKILSHQEAVFPPSRRIPSQLYPCYTLPSQLRNKSPQLSSHNSSQVFNHQTQTTYMTSCGISKVFSRSLHNVLHLSHYRSHRSSPSITCWPT